jgi:hypothetical protein
MSEPKKRGRPSKADIAAREAAQGHTVNGDTGREPEDVIEQRAVIGRFEAAGGETYVADAFAFVPAPAPELEALDRAQAYALRVWNGQAHDLKRADRIARVERALHGQNLPTDGIRYPGSDDDEEWDEADMQPVTWRKRS